MVTTGHVAHVRRVSARLTNESGRGWDDFLEHHGVTFSAVIEATGRLLGEHQGRALVDAQDVVELARLIDRERFKRR